MLNILNKLIEKVIGNKLQFQSILKDFIYSCQLGGLKQHSTTDVGVVLTYIIHMGWVKSLLTSTLAFDIIQFFPSLNHYLLPLILAKVGFDSRILSFFDDYLVDRKTSYLWNNFSSLSFNIGVSIGQSFALSPILSTLYLSSILYIFKKRLKNLKIPVSLISFVDNRLFISQNTSLAILNSQLFCSYHIMSSLL